MRTNVDQELDAIVNGQQNANKAVDASNCWICVHEVDYFIDSIAL